MRILAERILLVSVLAASACSARSAPREDTGSASSALAPIPPRLLYGPLGDGWRLLTGDFNGDGLRDVVWRHHASNRLSVSLMRGTQRLEQGPVLQGPPGSGWNPD